MIDSINLNTLNHKFQETEDYSWKSVPATLEEIEEARKDFKENRVFMGIFRSCWVCNSAHTHLIDKPALNCFVCGRLYHKGIDITDYSDTELEKYSHICRKGS